MRVPLVYLILTLASASAQEKAADFSDGLERLAALGLPEMKGAEWVKIPKDDPNRQLAESYELREIGVSLTGGAWRLPGDLPRTMGFGTPKVSEAAAGETREKTAADSAEKSPNLFQKMMRNHSAQKEKEHGPEKSAPPKPEADLAEEEASRMLDALSKDKTREELTENMGYGRYDMPGQLLVFAAQLHASGRTVPAGRLAEVLFSLAPDKAALVDAAVSRFANQEYEDAAEAFFIDYDWAKYHQAVVGLLAKYPRGWNRAGAMAMLIGPLEKRAKGDAIPTPSLPGAELKPQALDLLEEWLQGKVGSAMSDEDLAAAHGIDLNEIPAAQRERYLAMLRQHGGSMMGRGEELWLLAPRSTGKGALDKLKAMGMDGLIALAAVAEDPTLVPENHSRMGGSRYYSYGSNRSFEEIAQEAYLSMPRPASRGELALGLLKQVLPGEGDRSSSSEDDAESIKAAAVEFWTQNREKTPVELASIYLSAGDRSQRSTAGRFLASSKDESAFATFEKAVLSSGDPVSFIGEVETYLGARKDKGKAFFDAYAVLLRANAPSGDGDDLEAYRLEEAGGVEKFLKKLSLLVGSVSFKELVNDALKAEPDEDQEQSALEGLVDAARKTPLPEVMKVVAEAVPHAKPAQAAELYSLALSAAYGVAGKKDRPELPAEVIGLWKPLVGASEPLPGSGRAVEWIRGWGVKTLGDAAVLALEMASDPSSGTASQSFAKAGMIDEVVPFSRKRMVALLAGKNPEPWPQAGDVKEERRTEIEAKLSSLPAKEIPPFAGGLPMAEKLWLGELVTSFDGEEKVAPPGIMELGYTVLDLKSYSSSIIHDADLAGKLQIAPGWKIDEKSLEQLAEKLAADARTYSGAIVVFYSAPMMLGMNAVVYKAEDERSMQSLERFGAWFESVEGEPDALVMFSFGMGTDIWKLKDGKVALLPNDDGRESALSRLKEDKGTKTLAGDFLQLIALTREDALKHSTED